MKKINLLLLFTIVLMSCKNDKKESAFTPKNMGPLSISTDKPQPGETIDIAYKNDDLAEAFYIYMVNTKNYPIDIDFDSHGDERKSSIKIPDSADAIAFVFKLEDDDTYDDNDNKGYVLPLYNETGAQMTGSKSAAALFTIRDGSYYGIEADEEEVANILKNNLEAHPNLKDDWETTYLELAHKTNKDNGKALIENYLTTLSAKTDKTEDEFVSMVNFYDLLGEDSKADSIKAITIETFKNGSFANYEVFNTFRDEADLSKKVTIFENFKPSNRNSKSLKNYMANNIAQTYFNKGDMDNFEKYSAMVEDKSSRASTLNNLAWSLAEKGENLENAAKLSKTTLDLVSELQQNPEDKPDYYTQKQYEQNLKTSYSMYADTYAYILFQQGKVKEAIAYQEKAHDPKAKDAEANARFIKYLMADEQYEMVLEKAGKFLSLGHGNEDIKTAYKTAYSKVNPTLEDADKKISEFEKIGYDKQVAEIKSKMIDEAAQPFALKDMEGKTVTLAELKGKIVILDFWATWCGPCKASFPGMQKVVSKYKNDDNVALLFIDTFERGKNREQLVEDFIAKNKYDFHVLYDVQPEGSNSFEVADKYDVEGIPTKVIIGTDGRVKYKSVGYGGSTDKLVNEMDILISILKV